jgi:hypothetical protein
VSLYLYINFDYLISLQQYIYIETDTQREKALPTDNRPATRQRLADSIPFDARAHVEMLWNGTI